MRLSNSLGLNDPGHIDFVGENAVNLFISGSHGAGKTELRSGIAELYRGETVTVPTVTTAWWEPNLTEKIQLIEEEFKQWQDLGKILPWTVRESEDTRGRKWRRGTQPDKYWLLQPNTRIRMITRGPELALELAKRLPLKNVVRVFLAVNPDVAEHRMKKQRMGGDDIAAKVAKNKSYYSKFDNDPNFEVIHTDRMSSLEVREKVLAHVDNVLYR